MKLHRIETDIRGARYQRLITELLNISSYFSLMIRDDLSFDPDASDLLRTLATVEIKRKRTNRWPGTRSFAQRQPLIAYFLSTPQALGPLLVPGRLFGWQQPEYPEDPAFYDSEWRPLFGTIAHENEAWVLKPAAVRAVGQFIRLEVEDIDSESAAVILGAA